MIEHVHNAGSHLFYIGRRSSETRFGVIGWHYIREHGHFPYRMLELTYYPRSHGAARMPRTWVVPKKRRLGPFVVVRFRWGSWIEIDLGWRHKRRW